MAITARLYDADGRDQEIDLQKVAVPDLTDQQLLWVDVVDFDQAAVGVLAKVFGLRSGSVLALLEPEARPRVDNYGGYFHLNVISLQEEEGKFRLGELQFVISQNFVLTVHQKPIAFLDSFRQRIKGDSQIGRLDAPAFLAALLDWHVTAYFRIIEDLQSQVDRLDALAIRPRRGRDRDLLVDLSKLRQRVAFIRRTLAPHREVYATLPRPDFQLLAASKSADHFALLNGRFERAIEAIENTRELLVGSFEMFTTQIALRTTEAVKVLTIASLALLPTSVALAVAGLVLKTPVFEIGAQGFWATVAVIAAIGLGTIFYARYKRWM